MIQIRAMMEPNPRVYDCHRHIIFMPMMIAVHVFGTLIVGHTFTLSMPMMASIVSVGTLSVILNTILMTCKFKSIMRRRADDGKR